MKNNFVQVVPYKECKQGLEPQEFSETVLTPKKFIEKECVQNKKEIPHKKLLPECKNVTKQNCVTNWETDSYGNQVNDDVVAIIGETLYCLLRDVRVELVYPSYSAAL